MSGKRLSKLFREFFSGDFIINRNLDKYVGFGFFVFCLLAATLIWNVRVETRMIKVVDGENTIKELKILRDQSAIELLRLDHRDIVKDLLIKNNSQLTVPEEPAVIIDGGKL